LNDVLEHGSVAHTFEHLNRVIHRRGGEFLELRLVVQIDRRVSERGNVF
jgi:hypothetical protein